jgi:hypothetical protein
MCKANPVEECLRSFNATRTSGGKGSLSLQMAFSTAAGVMFVMLFYNLVQYVGTSAAVNEAARKAVRCVSPTDPACVSVAFLQAPNLPQEWFGYTGGESEENAALSVDYYRYGATMTRLQWGADYTTFQIHRARQPVTWTSYEVPVRVFSASVIPEEFTKVDSFFTPTWYEPKYEPNFPQAEDPNSFGAANDLGIQVWRGSPQSQVLAAHFQLVGPITATIDAGSYHEFSTDRIAIPRLDGVTANTQCRSSDGSLCDIGPAAGDISNTDSWSQSAHLAIKAFAQLRGIGGSGEAQWSKSETGTPGLYVKIYGPDGRQILGPDSDALGRCLGGGNWREAPDDGTWYNMRLRGTTWTTNGSTPVCPGTTHQPQGSMDFSSIVVPRGGSFSIHGDLYVSENHKPVEANVTFAYYYDDYKKTSERTAFCPSKTFTGSLTKAVCPGALECGVPVDKQTWGWEQTCSTAHFSGDCADSSAVEQAQNTSTDIEPQYAVPCQDNWRPQDPPRENIPQGYKFCSWDARTVLSVEVPNVPADCPLAGMHHRERTCEIDPVYGFGQDPVYCQNIYREISAINTAAALINSLRLPGTPTYGPNITVTWEAMTNDRWEFSWTPIAENGVELAAGTNQLKLVQAKLVDESSLIKRFKTKNGTQPAPQPSEFAGAVRSENQGNAAARGWDFYLQNINKYVKPAPAERLPQMVSLTSGYPFAEPVPEIYYGQDAAVQGWDFNRDCYADIACNDVYDRYDSLEAMLRHYAAKQLPEASDMRYEFAAEQQLVETMIYSDVKNKAQAQGIRLPACTPARLDCSPPAPGPDAELVSLGISDNLPQGCLNGTYYSCFSKPAAAVYNLGQASLQLDRRLVTQVALDELKRIIPYAQDRRDCTDAWKAGCVSVKVDLLEDKQAAVKVSYNMPLTFPLDVILGRQTLEISHTKEEALERGMVGRID